MDGADSHESRSFEGSTLALILEFGNGQRMSWRHNAEWTYKHRIQDKTPEKHLGASASRCEGNQMRYLEQLLEH